MPAFARYIHLLASIPQAGTTSPNKGIPKRPMTTEQKLAIVEDWKRSGLNKEAYCKAHNMRPDTLRDWSKGRGLGQVGKNSSHSPEIKAKVLELHKSGMSKRKIEQETGVASNTVYEWVQRWRHEGLV